MKEHIDYSDDERWRELQKRYSRAQDVLGVKEVLDVKRTLVGNARLTEVSPQKLREIIGKLIATYKRKKRNGKI